MTREVGEKIKARRQPPPAPATGDDVVAEPADAATDAVAEPSDGVQNGAVADDGGRPADKPARSSPPSVTSQIKEIRAAEDDSLKSVLDSLGADGSYRIRVRRLEPEEWRDPITGKVVKTGGTLKTYAQRIDEDFIADRHGGGRYQLQFLRRDKTGSYPIFTQRIIDVAGDPRVDDVPRTTIQLPAAVQVAAPSGENPSLVKEAFGIMREQIDRLGEKKDPAPRGIDPAIQMVLEQMRRDAERRDAELAELRKELATARNAKPPEDPIKDKLLGSLIDGQSGHVEALKLRQESELRQIKESALEEQRRRDDRAERDIAAIKSSYEREIAALKASHESSTAVTTQANNLQLKLLENDNKRLERDLESLRVEVKELRSRKDKTIIEQAKDLEAVKDALGLGDDGGEKSGFDKLIDVASSPAATEFIGRIVGSGQAKEAAPPAAPPAPAKPQLVRAPDGQTFLQVSDGKGGTRLVPMKKKPKVVPATVNPDGTVATPAIELPDIDQTSIAFVVGYLERAFSAKQDPDIVAQSGRTSVPEEILTWIRSNDTEQVSGVDLFMSKVAKLPSTSPLSSQAGRNWLRKVGKALVE